MSSNSRLLAPLALSALCMLASCADLSRGPASSAVDAGAEGHGEGGATDGAVVSFAAAVHPLLAAACQRCHAAGGEAGDTDLLLTGDAAADYLTVSPLVDTSAPAGSRLLSKASGNGHGGGTVFAAASPEYQTLREWIQQGAPP